MPWTNGTSRTSTTEWKRIREHAKHELDYECADQHRGPCAGQLELDHITPHAHGGTDDMTNLAWRCKRHHAMKSQREARDAKRARRDRGYFESEAHPGILK